MDVNGLPLSVSCDVCHYHVMGVHGECLFGMWVCSCGLSLSGCSANVHRDCANVVELPIQDFPNLRFLLFILLCEGVCLSCTCFANLSPAPLSPTCCNNNVTARTIVPIMLSISLDVNLDARRMHILASSSNMSFYFIFSPQC